MRFLRVFMRILCLYFCRFFNTESFIKKSPEKYKYSYAQQFKILCQASQGYIAFVLEFSIRQKAEYLI